MTNSRRIKIHVFTNLYPSPVEPERGIFISQLVHELRKRVLVEVICPLPWVPKRFAFAGINRKYPFSVAPSGAVIDEVQVYYPRYPLLPKVSDPLHALLMYLGVVRFWKRLMNERPCSAIIAPWVYPDGVCAQVFGLRRKIPVVLAARGCDINRDIHRPTIRQQILFALRRAAHIVTVSEGLRKAIESEGICANKLSVISNGVNRRIFRIRRKETCRWQLGLNPASKIIVLIAQLVPVKDHSTFLKAFALLRKNYHEKAVSAYLIGEGPLKSALEGQAVKLGISNDIHFIGQQPHDLIPLWLGASDVLCLSSIREGRPNVVIEALSCGRPVVATMVGGIPELVEKMTGILFPPGDHVQLSKCLKAALERPWDPEIIGRSVQQLTWEVAAERYLQIVRRITSSLGNLNEEQ